MGKCSKLPASLPPPPLPPPSSSPLPLLPPLPPLLLLSLSLELLPSPPWLMSKPWPPSSALPNPLNPKPLTSGAITNRTSGAEMTEKEALDAVAFLNKSLNDGIQLTEANVAPMDLKKCLIKGAGAVQNASNTLTCVVNQVNIWSKADCSLAATGVAALTDMNKLKAFASKHCLAKATTAQGSYI